MPLDRQGGSVYDLVWDVATQEMNDVGQDPQGPMPETAPYLASVQRIQAWTFEWMAARSTEAHNVAFREMFEELALRVRSISDIELFMGEPGACG